jgi:hypothetical protein
MREKIGMTLVGGIVLTLIIFMIVGIVKCSKTKYVTAKVHEVRTSYSAYYRAEYSESSWDIQKNEWDTDYWSRPASDVYTVKSKNNKVVESSAKVIKGLKCDRPPKYDNIKRSHLDGVYFRESFSRRGTLILNGGFNHMSLNETEYDYLLSHVGVPILIEVNGFGSINKILVKK